MDSSNGKGLVRVIVLVSALALIVFVGYQFVSQWLSYRALNAELAVLNTRIADVQKNNEQKIEDIKQSTSNGFIERMARELLGWVKPGEIKIVDKDGK